MDDRPQNRRRAVVLCHLQQQILYDYHSGQMAGNFSGNRLHDMLCVTSGGGKGCIQMLLNTVKTVL